MKIKRDQLSKISQQGMTKRRNPHADGRHGLKGLLYLPFSTELNGTDCQEIETKIPRPTEYLIITDESTEEKSEYTNQLIYQENFIICKILKPVIYSLTLMNLAGKI
uniref:Uncharacterized protein n=1 Tax=Romanomermis culicivorax TaxID=13658 RepID=A0A915J3L8_ROMCU